jgi:hypothetical protein
MVSVARIIMFAAKKEKKVVSTITLSRQFVQVTRFPTVVIFSLELILIPMIAEKFQIKIVIQWHLVRPSV